LKFLLDWRKIHECYLGFMNNFMSREHHYQVDIKWTGNKGKGTINYQSYERSHTISGKEKPVIQGSADPAFLGDSSKYNPEELLLASISSCHMLWFLHLCTTKGVVVKDYEDYPIGTMTESPEGGGKFTEVTLKPIVFIEKEEHLKHLEELHKQANKLCFIANSVNFPVNHEAIGNFSKPG